MKIAVIGTGYVGLVTGTCLAETGNVVTCVDINEQKVKMMQRGEVPIYEPGIEALFLRNIMEERLFFTTTLADAVHEAEMIFLALPTPPGEDGAADLSYVLGAAENIARLITSYKVIVTKSTVPVGTADKVKAVFARNTDVPVAIASNPEFLREGVAVEDFMKPDRIVVGTTDEDAKKLFNELYAPYVRQGNPIIFMDERSAELTKYAANAFLATKISFMNEIANLCEKLGADVDMVRLGVGTDERIGKRFLFAGIGYGGSCFPKEVQALARSAEAEEYDFKILSSVMAVNALQKQILVNKVKTNFGNDLSGKVFAMWGLSFKPETDDIREAPSLQIINSLLSAGARIKVYDPEAMANVKMLLGDAVAYGDDQYDVLKDTDALLVVTEWSVFRSPDFQKMGDLMKNKVIFDGRNLYSNQKLAEQGFYYNSIGRQPVGVGQAIDAAPSV
jgi:UDPglucose 6-dehydrogenase